MASIDKTYVSNYEDWKRVVDWARTAEFTCPNGTKLRAIDYCRNRDMSETEIRQWLSEQKEIPVMNTSWSMDYYIIKYCPLDIVQNQMREGYGEEYDEIKSGKCRFDTFTRDGRIGTKVIRKIQNGHGHFEMREKYINRNYVSKWGFRVFAEYNGETLWWSDAIKRFLWPDELGCWNSSCYSCNCKSIKALIRRLRKMELPKGVKVTAYGLYVYENWGFVVR